MFSHLQIVATILYLTYKTVAFRTHVNDFLTSTYMVKHVMTCHKWHYNHVKWDRIEAILSKSITSVSPALWKAQI